MNDNDLLAELRINPDQREDTEGRKYWWVFILAVVIIGIATEGYAVLRAQTVVVETATAEALPEVTNPESTNPETRGNAGSAAVLDATGYVTARLDATVSSKITGKLLDVLVEEGDLVTAGQVLAHLDDEDEQAQLKLAEAQLTAVKAQVGDLEARLDQAMRDLKRQQDLHARKLTPEQGLEAARTTVTSLRAELLAQRLQIDVAQAQLRIAQLNQDKTIIRAPFSGVVVAKAAQPGEIVSPISAGGGFTRTGICTLVDMDSLEIEVDVNESFINRVTAKQPVVAVLDAYPDWKIPAEVIAIIPTANRSKATVKVRIALKEKDSRVVPEMGVRVSFYGSFSAGTDAGSTAANQPQTPTSNATSKSVLVPGSAIAQRNGASVVYVVEDEHARQQVVTPGQSYGDLRLIENGLVAGQIVVREPPPELKDGSTIKLKTES